MVQIYSASCDASAQDHQASLSGADRVEP